MKSKTYPEISYAEWRRRVETQLGDLGVDEALTSRDDGVDLEALCTATHPQPPVDLRVPAGPRPSSPDELSWIPCQAFDNADLEKLNHHLKSDLSNGVPGIWLRLDRASRRGEDPLVSEWVGDGGAALYRLADFATALHDTPASWHTLLLDAGSSFLPSAAMLVGWLQASGRDPGTKTLLLGADPLGTLARDGRLPASFDRMRDDLAVLVRYSQEKWQQNRALAVSTQPYREAGAEIDQELAICLSTGAEYLRSMERSGLEPEATAAEVTFVTSTGQQIFLEIAKLRALRILWSQVLRACGVQLSTHPWIHASVLRRCLATREPSINLLRVTTASLAASVGGADSLETPGYDWFEPTGSSDRGRRLARNTQLILGLESQVGRVADCGGGSYFLAAVTQELVVRGWDLFQEIERQGGILESLGSGWLQEAVSRRWEERRQKLEQVDIPLTGVNIYTDPDPVFPAVQEDVTPSVRERIRQRFARQKEELGRPEISIPASSQTRWHWCLESAAENLSINEMSSALYGAETGHTVEPLRPRRDSEPFESESVGS